MCEKGEKTNREKEQRLKNKYEICNNILGVVTLNPGC